MDSRFKKIKNFRFGKCNKEDQLSCLPDELICDILSLLPTKDAAVASLSSKMMRSAFTRLTALDFDDSPISYCARKHPLFVDDFQLFKTFVSNVLHASKSPQLSRFRIGFGGDLDTSQLHFHQPSSVCGLTCFPHLDSTTLNSWIGFPLNRSGIREIDLRIHVRIPVKLPSALFGCQTLEVLKLDTNLDLKLVSSMPSFCLPNLKVLQLRSVLIPEDDFVSRIVSSCPSLEELYMNCWWKCGKSIAISSQSLRKLSLFCNRHGEEYLDLCDIDTPNLQYFKYWDNLALHYSIPSTKALVEASLHVWNFLGYPDKALNSVLGLVTAVSNVERLSLGLSFVQVLDCEKSKYQQLPVFQNLRHLKLGHDGDSKWDRVLLEFLESSPLLETLGFPKACDCGLILGADGVYYEDSDGELERSFFRTNQQVPCCCKSYLKRVHIKKCWGSEREVELVRFLLKIGLVLEELLVICVDRADKPSFESRLKKLPKASSHCFITVI